MTSIAANFLTRSFGADETIALFLRRKSPRKRLQRIVPGDCFTFEQQKSTLKLLAIAFGSDPVFTDFNRISRLPGFLNCKYDPVYPVTVEYPSDSTWNPDAFRLDIAAANGIVLPCAIPWRKYSGKHSNSERDSAWVVHELGHGKDAGKLTPTLASLRVDIASPLLLRTGIGRTLSHRRYPDGRRCHDA